MRVAIIGNGNMDAAHRIIAEAAQKADERTSTTNNSDYATALKVYLEYRSNDKNYSTGGFAEFCEKRLHSEEPNVA